VSSFTRRTSSPQGTDLGAAFLSPPSSSVAVPVREGEPIDLTFQDDLVRAVAAANSRTVVVVNSGSPILMPWRNDVAAVLLSWFGGKSTGMPSPTSCSESLNRAAGYRRPGLRRRRTYR
jgi:Glycosyl hydrolase family 3 C-terminal domain